MKILVIGSGGREHALVWKIAQSDRVEKIFCAPGNPGTAELGENIDISPLDFEKLAAFVKESEIDLTVVGPEDPLVEGIVDYFGDRGLKIFGPSKNAARLEGSKHFSKELMKKYQIPTADFKVFSSPEKARDYIEKEANFPLVLKASGLAAGKGVLICQSKEDALFGIKEIMEDKTFGSAGDNMVIEEYLDGEEISIFAISDGNDYLLLSPAQDHKKVFDGDQGKNTGGMGAYAPAPIATPEFIEKIKPEIINRTFEAMRSEGMPYRGLLYFGLIITKEGPKVLEYNCRFGDPEAEVILPLLKSDLVTLMEASIEGGIGKQSIQLYNEYALDVVLASGGYPESYEKGKVIRGLESLDPNILVFHAGTKSENNNLLTNGGRVLNIVARAEDFLFLTDFLYKNVARIKFDGAHYRKDIGYRARRYFD
jgi:phosphoribosylamine--glycine ligase